MATVNDHYANHLAPVYEWMVGDIGTALQRSADELDVLGLRRKPSDAVATIAIDLGAGIGLHALPMAQRGYSVLAVDSSEHLLAMLESRAGALSIRMVNADLLAFRQYIQQAVQVILCMGDTLTHLPSLSAVTTLIADIATSLTTGGMFVATFRDYATKPLTAEQRFIPVHSDAQRILTCFLEYQNDVVMVHDLLHEWRDERWQQRVSCYPKLRLAPDWLSKELQRHDFSVQVGNTSNGMVCVAATKV